MIADYWLLRRTELDVPDLYRPNGRYAGVNWIAIAALVARRAAQRAGLPQERAHHRLSGGGGAEDFFDEIYVYAWFTGFLIAGVLYLVGMRMRTSAPVGGATPALD